MERVTLHYSALGVEALFKHLPRLEEYLKVEFNDGLVSNVRIPLHSSPLAPAN
jgi:hypothetical protein